VGADWVTSNGTLNLLRSGVTDGSSVSSAGHRNLAAVPLDGEIGSGGLGACLSASAGCVNWLGNRVLHNGKRLAWASCVRGTCCYGTRACLSKIEVLLSRDAHRECSDRNDLP